MANKLVEKRNELAAKQKKLAGIWEESGAERDLSKVKSLQGDNAAKLAEIRRMNEELEGIQKEVAELVELEEMAAQNAKRAGLISQPASEERPPMPDGRSQPKAFGELFLASAAYKDHGWKNEREAEIPVSMKTLFETGAGWQPESIRSGTVVPYATRPIQVMDLIPGGRTGQNSFKYMEETTFTPAAAETAEGGSYPEAAFALTERTATVQKVPVFIPVTEEQLEDVDQVQTYLEARLRFAIQQRIDNQIMNGDAISPNLQGIVNHASVQTQARGADTNEDAIYKAIVKVQVTGRASPSAVVINPNNFQTIRLRKTVDGVYIFGNPSERGPSTLWGLPAVSGDVLSATNAHVGAFQDWSMLLERIGIEVKISDSHSDYFIKGKLALRARTRVVVVWLRPAAFCNVTGLN